jgi:hypothetical protein
VTIKEKCQRRAQSVLKRRQLKDGEMPGKACGKKCFEHESGASGAILLKMFVKREETNILKGAIVFVQKMIHRFSFPSLSKTTYFSTITFQH